MREKKIVCFILVSILVSVILGFFNKSSAKINIGAVPAKITLDLLPGSEHIQKIKVYNKSEKDLYFKAYLEDYWISPEGEFEFYPPGEKAYSCANWISIPEEKFFIPANDSKSMEIMISVPENAGFGNRAVTIFFETLSSSEVPSTGVSFKARIGIPVNIAVIDPERKAIKRSAIIRNFKIDIDYPELISFKPFRIHFLNFFHPSILTPQILFENTGNAYLNVITYGEIICECGYRKFSTGKFLLGKITSLPDSLRIIKTEIKGPPFGICEGKVELAFTPEEWKTLKKKFLVINPDLLIILAILFVFFGLLLPFLKKWINLRKVLIIMGLIFLILIAIILGFRFGTVLSGLY